MLHEAIRNCVYLALELRRPLHESRTASPHAINRLFAERPDPWGYDVRPEEDRRLALQAECLDKARGTRLFEDALEIGCAEGRCTEILEPRCLKLTVCDVSPVALSRARARRRWRANTVFAEFDVRHDPIEEPYDLITATGVLEYFSRRSTLVRTREKLVAALRPGGLLLLETTAANPVVERAWWSRWLIRGRWINHFVASHPALEVVHAFPGEDYHGMLCRKRVN